MPAIASTSPSPGSELCGSAPILSPEVRVNNRDYLHRIDTALAELGFAPRTLRPGGHFHATHPRADRGVFIPATPSDHRSLANVLAELERTAGRRLHKPSGYRGGKRAPAPRRSLVHDKSENELEARTIATRARAEIAALDTIIDSLVQDSSNPFAHRTAILRHLTTRTLAEGTLGRLNQPAPPCEVPGLAALQAQWSPARDDVPCSDEHLALLRRAWGQT